MRHLRRPQYTPPIMGSDGSAGRQRLSDVKQYEQSRTVPAFFNPYWSNHEVIGLLYAMQGRICVYCSSMSSSLEVEHFRPKGPVDEEREHGGYWWLAYDCSNYFLSCGSCNRRKGTRFPLTIDSIRCSYHTRETILTEQRVLLDPCQDPVEEWLTIDAEDIGAKLIPNPGLSAGDKSRIQDAIDILGLNIDTIVRSQRSKAYEEATRAAYERRWDHLQTEAMRHRPHSLVARIVLQRVAPERLPTAKQEMMDLVYLLWTDLRTVIHEIQDLQTRDKLIRRVDKRQRDSLVLALIILLKDPPARDWEGVNIYLQELLNAEDPVIRDEIISLFRSLGHPREPKA